MIELTNEMKAAAARRMGVPAGVDLDPWAIAAIEDVLAIVDRDNYVSRRPAAAPRPEGNAGRCRMTTYEVSDGPKMLRETLCAAQAAIGNSAVDVDQKPERIDRLQRLIDACDARRPLGPDGKHGDRHTSTCGCNERPGDRVHPLSRAETVTAQPTTKEQPHA